MTCLEQIASGETNPRNDVNGVIEKLGSYYRQGNLITTVSYFRTQLNGDLPRQRKSDSPEGRSYTKNVAFAMTKSCTNRCSQVLHRL